MYNVKDSSMKEGASSKLTERNVIKFEAIQDPTKVTYDSRMENRVNAQGLE